MAKMKAMKISIWKAWRNNPIVASISMKICNGVRHGVSAKESNERSQRMKTKAAVEMAKSNGLRKLKAIEISANGEEMAWKSISCGGSVKISKPNRRKYRKKMAKQYGEMAESENEKLGEMKRWRLVKERRRRGNWQAKAGDYCQKTRKKRSWCEEEALWKKAAKKKCACWRIFSSFHRNRWRNDAQEKKACIRYKREEGENVETRRRKLMRRKPTVKTVWRLWRKENALSIIGEGVCKLWLKRPWRGCQHVCNLILYKSLENVPSAYHLWKKEREILWRLSSENMYWRGWLASLRRREACDLYG